MKANRKFILGDNEGYTKIVAGLVVLLLVIVVGVMIYFETLDAVSSFDDTTTEYFTGYSATWVVGKLGEVSENFTCELDNSPAGSGNVNVTVTNNSAKGTEQYPSFTVNHRWIQGTAENYTQVNITYTSNIASAEGSQITPVAENVFGLAPIIALVIVAAIILGVVLTFGGRKGGNV